MRFENLYFWKDMKISCVFSICHVINKFFNKQNDFESEALEIHNQYRQEHGAPPLSLNKDICKVSQKWAEELASKDNMSYSLNKEYGESVYCGWTSDPNTKITAKDCIDKWYSEVNDYPFGNEPTVLSCGHFTQIVWKSTKELGIGYAKNKTSGKVYVVANYSPPGNFSGQFLKNVLPPGAMQFTPDRRVLSEPNNNQQPSNQRTSRNLGDIATDLVGKLKAASIGNDKFEKDFLNAHNELRKKHGVPPLVISKKLNKFAEEWAKIIAKKGNMEHRDQNEYGENIFFAWSSDPDFEVSGAEPVEKWYSEIKDHRFGREPTDLRSGHFTQVIWADTKEVGFGIAKSKDGKIFVVANYNPPGNIIGSFAKKVPAPL